MAAAAAVVPLYVVAGEDKHADMAAEKPGKEALVAVPPVVFQSAETHGVVTDVLNKHLIENGGIVFEIDQTILGQLKKTRYEIHEADRDGCVDVFVNGVSMHASLTDVGGNTLTYATLDENGEMPEHPFAFGKFGVDGNDHLIVQISSSNNDLHVPVTTAFDDGGTYLIADTVVCVCFSVLSCTATECDEVASCTQDHATVDSYCRHMISPPRLPDRRRPPVRPYEPPLANESGNNVIELPPVPVGP